MGSRKYSGLFPVFVSVLLKRLLGWPEMPYHAQQPHYAPAISALPGMHGCGNCDDLTLFHCQTPELRLFQPTHHALAISPSLHGCGNCDDLTLFQFQAPQLNQALQWPDRLVLRYPCETCPTDRHIALKVTAHNPQVSQSQLTTLLQDCVGTCDGIDGID